MKKKRLLLIIAVLLLILLTFFINKSKYKNIIDDLTISKQKHDIHIVVDIDANILYVYDILNKEIISKYYIATGKWNTPTPTGTYKIIEKAIWGGSFGSKWMKLNVPWGQYGIHGTNKPYSIGYFASHGCVRMKNKDIDELYSLVKYGTKVTLFKGSFGPFGYGFRTLKPGDTGEDVMEVQRRLKILGYYYGRVDGIYGSNMKSALCKFLKDNNMEITSWISKNIYKELNIILFE